MECAKLKITLNANVSGGRKVWMIQEIVFVLREGRKKQERCGGGRECCVCVALAALSVAKSLRATVKLHSGYLVDGFAISLAIPIRCILR